MLLTLYYCWWVSIAQYQSFPCTLLARDHACYLKLFLFNSLGLKETKMESMLTHSWTRIWVGLAADGLGYWLCVGIKHPQVIQQETAQHVKHSLDLFQVCVCVCLLSVCHWWSTSCRFWSGVVFHSSSPHSESGASEMKNIYWIDKLINLLSPPTEIKQSIVD